MGPLAGKRCRIGCSVPGTRGLPLSLERPAGGKCSEDGLQEGLDLSHDVSQSFGRVGDLGSHGERLPLSLLGRVLGEGLFRTPSLTMACSFSAIVLSLV